MGMADLLSWRTILSLIGAPVTQALTDVGFRILKLKFPVNAMTKLPLRFRGKFDDVFLKILNGMPPGKHVFDSSKAAMTRGIRYHNTHHVSYVERHWFFLLYRAIKSTPCSFVKGSA